MKLNLWLQLHERELNSIAVIPLPEWEQARINACRFRWARNNLFDRCGCHSALRILRELRFIP